MQFGHTIVYVNDVLKTIDFYQTVFSLQLKFLHENHQYAEMQTGATTLAFASESLANNNGLQFRPNRLSKTPTGFEISFVAEEVELAFEQCSQERAKQVALPEKKLW